MAAPRRSVGGNGSRASAKPELVHEMSERTTLSPGQPPGQSPRRVFEGRFKSVAILDEEALLATCVYIDLNPVAAGIVDVPEASPHTSITTRIEHVKKQGRLADLTTVGTGTVDAHDPGGAKVNSHGLQPLALGRLADLTAVETGSALDHGPNGAEVNSHGLQPLALLQPLAPGRIPDLTAAKSGSAAGSNAAAGLEESIWLCPVEDRRKVDSSREGMLEGFSLGNYVLLVEYTGRLFRDGKAVISAELSGILERIGLGAESWWARIEKLSKGRLLGRFFAASRARLREVAAHLGVHHLANFAACSAR